MLCPRHIDQRHEPYAGSAVDRALGVERSDDRVGATDLLDWGQREGPVQNWRSRVGRWMMAAPQADACVKIRVRRYL